MNKIIVEVGSTCTKVDKYDGEQIERLETITIGFKRNYKKENKLDNNDVEELINNINKLKDITKNIYVCGTSIFRNLTDSQREEFLNLFKEKTELNFEIISQEQENELTVLGATRNANQKVAVFVGGGGSTEIATYENGIKEMINTSIGVIDILNKYPDLSEDLAKTDLEIIKKEVRDKLNIPKQKADILILAGGGHKYFAINSGINYEENDLYTDELQPIKMDIETRIKDTKRYYTEISLDEIRSRVDDPNWWSATRAMCAFALVVAEAIGAKYIVPTDISIVHGLLDAE